MAASITRNDILKAVLALPEDHPKRLVRSVFDAMLEEIGDALATEGSVKLRSFGNFRVIDKAARVGRNPRNGESYPIHARRVVSFKASPVVLEAVRSGTTVETALEDSGSEEATRPRHMPARTTKHWDRIEASITSVSATWPRPDARRKETAC